MKKNEFIAKVAEKSGLSKVASEQIVQIVSDLILDSLLKKDHIPFGNFGQFKYKKCAARVCRMIKTGEKTQIPEKGGCSFTMSKYAKIVLGRVV